MAHQCEETTNVYTEHRKKPIELGAQLRAERLHQWLSLT